MTQSFESFGVHETRITRLDDISDPTAVLDRRRVYGYIDNGLDHTPDTLTSPTEAAGGFLAFPRDISRGFTDELVSIAGLASTERVRRNKYAIDVTNSSDAGIVNRNGFLRKLVIADRLALRDFYHSISEDQYDHMQEQPLDVAELVAAFFEDERKKFDAHSVNSLSSELGFGFAIENRRFGVISAWSRLYTENE